LRLKKQVLKICNYFPINTEQTNKHTNTSSFVRGKILFSVLRILHIFVVKKKFNRVIVML